VEDFADDLSLEAADDVAFAEAFHCASGDVVDRGLVEPHPDDHGAVDRGVQLSVAAVIDPVPPRGHPRRCGDGADPGKFRQRCFGADAFGVVADDDEDLGRGVDADSERLDELRGDPQDEFLDHRLELCDLSVESEPAACEGAECVADAVVGRFEPSWSQ
jgi:hypothetical protein